MIKELLGLLVKEFVVEWKQRYALSGLLLYVFSMVTVIALTFNGQVNPKVWNGAFWVIMLFAGIQTAGRSFLAEQPGQLIYTYTLARAEAVILSKMIFSALVLAVAGLMAFTLYAIMADMEIASLGSYIGLVLLGALGLSANLTLMAALAARADNRTVLMAVLSFPLVTPVLLSLIEAGEKAISGFESALGDAAALVAGLSAMLALISVVLFPMAWRE